MTARSSLTRTALVGLVSLVLAGCYWTQPGYNAHRTGHNPHEHAITAANAHTLDVDWTGPAVDGPTQLIRSNAHLHVLEQPHGAAGVGRVTTLDPADGQVVWVTDFPVGNQAPTVVATRDSLYVPSYLTTGAIHGCLRRLSVADGTDHGCVALDAPEPTQVSASGHVDFQVVAAGPWVVTTMGYDDQTDQWRVWLAVTHVTDPSRSWGVPLDHGESGFFANPVVIGQHVFTTVTSDDLETVLLRWPLDCPDPCTPTRSAPTAVEAVNSIAASADGSQLGLLGYGGDAAPDLEVIDAATGSTLWTADLGENLFPISHLMWTPDRLVAHLLLADVPADDELLAALPAAGCGSPSCAPVWTQVVGASRMTDRVVGAADVIAYGTSEHAVVVMSSACSSACEPLFELDSAGYWQDSRPIITDGRIITTVNGPDGSLVVALAPAG